MAVKPLYVFLNDDDTYTGVDGCTIVASNGECYDLATILSRTFHADWPMARIVRPDRNLDKMQTAIQVAGDADLTLV